MTPKERADRMGYAIATYPDDAQVEVYRSEIAAGIRDALAEELETVARMVQELDGDEATVNRAVEAIRERVRELFRGVRIK